jgi:H+/Cl- antiporter ClcA
MKNKEGWRRVAIMASAIWILIILLAIEGFVLKAWDDCGYYFGALNIYGYECFSGWVIVALIAGLASAGVWLIRYVYQGFFPDE